MDARFCPLLLILTGLYTAAAWDLVLLHTNDVHARVEETSVYSGKCTTSGRDCYGGVARRATMVKQIRSSHPNVLLLDAGDQFQGTVWFNFYKGAEAAHFMNLMQYDAMVFGNHEFDNGVSGLMTPFLQSIQTPILSANIKADPPLDSTFGKTYMPYKIINLGNKKVGLVGYTSKETPTLSRPGPHLHFEDEVTALQLQVDKLQTLGVNMIIALGHSGFIVDKEIARRVQGVDVVIGGHTNTFLYTGTAPSIELPAGPYPFLVTSLNGRQVPVVQAYAYGKYLGWLNVTFDDGGNVVKASGNPILLNSSVPEDPDVLADVEKWKESLANYSAQVVGQTMVFLNGSAEACRFQECNLGNLICDAMVENTIRFSGEQQWNHVSASIFNGGGIRTSIDERSRNGSITMEDLIAVLPFGGTFDLVQLSGSTLKKVFEHSAWRYGQRAGEFLQVAGFHVEYDASKKPHNRVKTLKILCTECRVPIYEPVQDSLLYKVVMPSYLVTGGDGFGMIPKELKKHDSGDLDISVVSNYISQRQRVYPHLEGRIKILSTGTQLSGSNFTLVLLISISSLCGIM